MGELKRFVSQNEILLKEWDYSKNKISPDECPLFSKKKMWWKCSTCGYEWETAVAYRASGSRCPVCTHEVAWTGHNDLKTLYPTIAKMWDSEKNSATPDTILPMSNRKFWWRCEKGHSFQDMPNTLTQAKNSCPYCSGYKILAGFNDLATINPKVANEWHPSKNGNLLPRHVSAKTNKKVWWLCENGHEWEMTINQRYRGQGCPYCSGRRIWVGFNDLATTNPDIIEEWDYEKNGELGIFPTKITKGSTKSVWWRCRNGHGYHQTISKKVKGYCCPICSGKRTLWGNERSVGWCKLKQGENDLETKCPELAKEWHPTKNEGLLPSQIYYKFGGKIWWKCKYGHEWEATVRDRVNDHTGCPECAKRRQTSFPQEAILYYVKKLYSDTISRYTDIFKNGMELDVYIPSRKIGIEYDGANWHRTKEHYEKEVRKYKICQENGIKLIRVKEDISNYWMGTADQIYGVHGKKRKADLDIVIQTILDEIDPESNMWTRKNPLKVHSSVLVNIERDRNEILEYLTQMEDSLADLRPDLAAEWHPTKNGKLLPQMFGINSNEKAWWRCAECGYEWETSIIHRGGKRNSGCPECKKIQRGKTFSRRCAEERGSLAQKNPGLALQWHPSLNGELKPSDVAENYNSKVWWLCPVCGLEWQQTPNSRKKSYRCPCCCGRVPRRGVNDLATVNPTLATEWNYEKNAPKKPEEYLPNSGKKVMWKCRDCGTEWEAEIGLRTQGYGRCPRCYPPKTRKKIF